MLVDNEITISVGFQNFWVNLPVEYVSEDYGVGE